MNRPNVFQDTYPDAPEAVTPAWLEAVLRERHPELPSIASLEACRVGTGQVGQCVRFTLGYAGDAPADAPRSVVGKFASADPTSREAGKAVRCYVQEVGFYRDLQRTVAIRTPYCYFAAIDDSEISHALVLEDMAPARQGDQIAGCSVDEAEAALEQLARLHAPRWNDPSLASLAWMEQPGGPRTVALAAFYDSLLPQFEQRYGERLEPSTVELCRDMSAGLARRLADTSGPHTIVHRDFRLDNLLFGDGVSAPRVAAVDWQTVGRGPAAADLAYFLGAGLPTELRRVHERELVNEYHRALIAGGVEDYAFDDLWRDYCRATTAGLLMTVIASMIVGETERGDEMFMTMARRHAAHALDLDARRFF